MASSFVVGDHFRNKVTQLLERGDTSLPQALREELEELLKRSQPTTLTFSTARKLKKHLEENGNKPEDHGDVSILQMSCVVGDHEGEDPPP